MMIGIGFAAFAFDRPWSCSLLKGELRKESGLLDWKESAIEA